MSTAVTIGKLGLEGLMDRANIAFTNGYRFKGAIDVQQLQTSIQAVCNSIIKFEHQVHFISQDNFSWQNSAQRDYTLRLVAITDLDEGFAILCSNSYVILRQQNHAPMSFTLIQPPSPKNNTEFIIAQLCNHTYVDARSAEVIFNKIIELYNRLCQQDNSAAEAVLSSIQKLHTAPPDIVIEERFNASPKTNHKDNVEKIMSYQIDDVGQYAIPISDLDNTLIKYKATSRKPLIQFFRVDEMIRLCREKQPKISKNSIICAVLVRAIYNINVQEKGIEAEHIISFKMLSDILTPTMRQKYSGNYIAFVPVTVEGNQSLENIAKDIDDRVIEFKSTNLDVSVFSLTEDAVKAAMVGTADEPLSFIVTNWNNITFTTKEDFLNNCQSIRHQSGVNIEPKDCLGASLVNRPVFVINFSPNGELCLSLFPSLESVGINQNIDKQLKTLFAK